MTNILGAIPEFTSDAPVIIPPIPDTEVVESTPEEKETPPEPPAENETVPPKAEDDTNLLVQQLQGLQEERKKLLQQIHDLRGQRRELKQEELIKVEKKIDDELKDVNPEDVTVVERILRSKGYITKEESHQMFYESVKNEELEKFLIKYPEYKPENDPNDTNWGSLQKELGYYRKPTNPHDIAVILERAHRSLKQQVGGDRDVSVKKRQLEVAGVGGGGVQRSSSRKSLNPSFRQMYEQGGWSEEEIKRMEANL